MNILFFYLIIIIIVSIIIHSYSEKELNKLFFNESENKSENESESENINENFQTISINEINAQTNSMKQQINEIQNLITTIRQNKSSPRWTKDDVNSILNIYNKVLSDIKKDNILTRENKLFKSEQYFQDKKIEKYFSELESLKTKLELLTNVNYNSTIRSVKNPISGINLNIHNVSPTYNKVYAEVDHLNFGSTDNETECIVKCKNKDDCVGITYDNTEKTCKGTNIINTEFEKGDKNDNKVSWEKNNGALIYLNGKCLNYYQDVILVKINSGIKNWIDCEGLKVGRIKYKNSIDAKQKEIDNYLNDEYKMVKPEYKYYTYDLSLNVDTIESNSDVIDTLINDFKNASADTGIIGIRLPLKQEVRNEIINKLRDELDNYKFIDINSSYDLNRCSISNKNQIFEIKKITELSDYNNMVRKDNNMIKGYEYKTLNSEYEITNINETEDVAKFREECKNACNTTNKLTCKLTNHDLIPHLSIEDKCIANPKIIYNNVTNVIDCKKQCIEDANCLGVNFYQEDANNEAKNEENSICEGVRFDGHLNKSISEDSNFKYSWNKFADNQLKTLDYTPTPFYVISNKNKLSKGQKDCLTIDGNNISITPCNLGLNQRWNSSKKYVSC